MNTLQLNFTLDEANQILKALGNLPYVEVHGLIRKIQEDAARQLESTQHGAAPTGEAKTPEKAEISISEQQGH